MSNAVWVVIGAVNVTVLAYFVAVNVLYLCTSIMAFRFLTRYNRRLKRLDVGELAASRAALPITLIAPGYNEEANCVESIRSLLTLQYPRFEVLFVNDGSSDQTLKLLREAFDLVPAWRLTSHDLETAPIRATYRSTRHPNLWVLDKQNGGKADAINAGLNACRTPLFCVIDADSLLERDALVRVSRPFLEDANTVAAGGIIRIVNGSRVRHGIVEDLQLPRNLWARLQILEYARAFLTGRIAWSELNASLIISGAFGLFRRSVVVEAGGYSTNTVGEDMEVVVRIHRHCRERGIPYKISFIPDPVAWTECPETIRGLSRQRDRWQRGLIESLVRHRRMLLNPRYGTVGMLAFPYFWIFEMIGPGIEAVGYLAFAVTVAAGKASLPYIIAFLSLALVLGMTLTTSAVAMQELTLRVYARLSDMLHLIWLSIVENVGYRQLSQYWRVLGTVSAMRRVKRWGTAPRKGFAVQEK